MAMASPALFSFFSLTPPYQLRPPFHRFPTPSSLAFPLCRRRGLPPPSSGAAESPSGDDMSDPFLEAFRDRSPEAENEARRRNWIDRNWAPWEEVLTPEGLFARKALNEGEEVELKTPEAIEAFKMLKPSYRRKKAAEMGMTEEEMLSEQYSIQPEVPDKLETVYDGELPLRLVPPRDWPPPGWEVDQEELEFIRVAQREARERVDMSVEKIVGDLEVEKIALDRYKVYLKQYKEWAAANKDRLAEESLKCDQDYYPGRRKRGKDYKDDMLELPFFYPGQICRGKVVTLHLHQGAFVDIGGVHDGWVPIKGNDWYWIRHHIKVGMFVLVEILAKRDPYRFRFPIEMRLVYPNIDHLIFNKFDYPPIFRRPEDTNPEQLWRECGRRPIPRKRPPEKMEEQPLLSNHPYVDQLWQLHNAEQLILDHEAENPEKYKDRKYESTVDLSFDHANSVEHTEAYWKKTLLPKAILKTDIKELDLDAARAERQMNNKLRKEAEERGERFQMSKLRRNREMDEYDLMHWRRSLEEREALIRDISCRQALGLPIEEPGRYDNDEKEVWGKNHYDPTSPLYRHDYWGEPKNSEKSQQERETEAHNQSIIGGATKWYEMPYEEAIEQRERREAEEASAPEEAEASEEDEDDDGIDFDYSIFSTVGSNSASKPVVNGSESLFVD